MPVADQERRQKLKAALSKIEILPGREPHLQSALDGLCGVDNDGRGTAPPKFRIKSSKGGRPPNVRAFAVSAIVGNYYHLVTGKKPTLTIPVEKGKALLIATQKFDFTPSGSFFNLMAEIFQILELEESIEHFAKSICGSFEMPPKRFLLLNAKKCTGTITTPSSGVSHVISHQSPPVFFPSNCAPPHFHSPTGPQKPPPT